MTDAIFSLLTSKVSFDRSRFKKDIDVFDKKRKRAAKAAGSLDAFLASGGKDSGDAKASAEDAEEVAARKRKKTVKSKEIDGADGLQMFRAGRERSGEGASSSAPSATRDPHEAQNAARKAHKIKVSGGVPPPLLETFEELATQYSASHKLLRNLASAGFAEPTAIQRQAIPCLLAGHDLFAVAPTGSGKTLAFLLPGIMKTMALRKADAAATGVTVLVLNPTRELAAQTFRVLKLLTANTGVKGSLLSKASAAGTAFDKVHIVVAAPMLLVALLRKHKVDLASLRYLILDEADKLFEMGFLEQIDAVFAAAARPDLCRALFSATLPEKVEAAARSVLQLPTRITVGERNSAVKQRLLFVGKEEGKLMALQQMVAAGLKPPVLVFVASKERAQALYGELAFDGVHVDCIHADQSQVLRSSAVDNFRAGKTWLLIATDLVGRGMDFLGVNTVVNYDFPFTPTDYIHRIGRTGRAGLSGEAVTFFEEDDASKLRAIANVMRAAGCEIPEWMLLLKKGAQGDARVWEKGASDAAPAGRGGDGGQAAGRKAAAAVSLHSMHEARQASRKAQIVRQSKEKKLRERTRVKKATPSSSVPTSVDRMHGAPPRKRLQ